MGAGVFSEGDSRSRSRSTETAATVLRAPRGAPLAVAGVGAWRGVPIGAPMPGLRQSSAARIVRRLVIPRRDCEACPDAPITAQLVTTTDGRKGHLPDADDWRLG